MQEGGGKGRKQSKKGGAVNIYSPNDVQPEVYFDKNDQNGGKGKKGRKVNKKGGDLGGSLIAILLVSLEEAWRNKIKQSGGRYNGEYIGENISNQGLNLYQNSGVSLSGSGNIYQVADPSGAVTNASGPIMRGGKKTKK